MWPRSNCPLSLESGGSFENDSESAGFKTDREYDMIYLTTIGWPRGGSSSVHIHTHTHTNNTENDTKQTIHRTTQKNT
jgi:hypothetical protein